MAASGSSGFLVLGIYLTFFLSRGVVCVSSVEETLDKTASLCNASWDRESDEPLPTGPGVCICPTAKKEVDYVDCSFRFYPSEREYRDLSRISYGRANGFSITSWPRGAIKKLPPSYWFTEKSLPIFTIKMANLNYISSFSFGNLTYLSKIFLRDNSIFELMPNAFANLEYLWQLHLNQNNLTEIKAGIFINLPKLEYLALSQNKINKIDNNAFENLNNLRYLILSDNELTQIERKMFAGLQSLKHLGLHGNRIHSIGDNVFAEMRRLKAVVLSENNIHSISSKGFLGLGSVGNLILNDNKIVSLHPATMLPLANINQLELKNNGMKTLNYSVMEPIYENMKDAFADIDIEGNEFVCDCQILWMQNLYNETKSRIVKEEIEEVTCEPTDSLNRPGENATTLLKIKFKVLNLTRSELGCSEDFKNFDSVASKTSSLDKQENETRTKEVSCSPSFANKHESLLEQIMSFFVQLYNFPN